MHFGDAVVNDLDAVVQVGELVLLAADVGCEDILKHLWDVGVVAGLRLLVGLLFVDLLRGEVGLLLVPGWAVAVRLFTRVCVGRRDNEFVDFEGVGIFSGGGADAKVVAFWEIDLRRC